MFGNIYKGKKVIVTGNTGFKGSWLTTWLLELGANVVGISDCVPTTPSMFEELKLRDKIKYYEIDIRNFEQLKEAIVSEKPDFVFHLAAQAIVSTSYSNPLETIQVNAMGTAHVLESLRALTNKCVAIMITSDKCYENVEWCWGYKETDALGGKDIYSASKAAAEVIIHAYQKSFFADENGNVKIAVARAGNVIGGGDWAKDRIVVDCVKSWSKGEVVEIRSPSATRPWQHVLEPLSGYLALGQDISSDNSLHGEAFNFGPRAEQNRTVLELLEDLSKFWHFDNPNEAYSVVENRPFNEAGLLKLNCDKALFSMKWQATMNYKSTVGFVSKWYYSFYKEKQNMFDLTIGQIKEYSEMAREQELKWTK